MNLSIYSSRTFALLVCCGCTSKNGYILQEKEGYYTQNDYQLDTLESFEQTICILTSPDAITNFRKKLADRTSKWCTSGTEKTPYELWNNFFKQEIVEKIVKKLQKQTYDTILLENYYDSFGKLFKEPTEENEKEVITSIKKLQANATLEQAFKTCIAERYNKPETINLTKSTLEYQELLYFMLNKPNKNNTLHIKLRKFQSNLVKWKEDGHPTGQQLWNRIQEKEINLLNDAPLYAYTQNREAIEQSLKLIDQLADNPYILSYKDLLATLPHGIKQLNGLLYQVQLKETDDTKLLNVYLRLVASFYGNKYNLS